jgi:hypothetical protein
LLANITDQSRELSVAVQKSPGLFAAHPLVLLQSVWAMRLDPARLYGCHSPPGAISRGRYCAPTYFCLSQVPPKGDGGARLSDYFQPRPFLSLCRSPRPFLLLLALIHSTSGKTNSRKSRQHRSSTHGLNLLVTSDGGLVRIPPRDRVALQDAHLRSGVRLIARNRSGRRDEAGAPMALVPEG